MAGMRMDTVREGRIAEHWAVFDLASLMAQLSGSQTEVDAALSR